MTPARPSTQPAEAKQTDQPPRPQDGGDINPGKQNGKFDRSYTIFGVSFKPVTQLAIKADYQIYNDHGAGGANKLDNDKFRVTLGFVF